MPTGPRPQPPVGTARVALSGLISTHGWVNVLYLKLTHTNPVTVNDLETILNGVSDNWNTDIGSQLTTNVSLNAVAASFITGVGTSLDYTHTETHSGSQANPIQNIASCVVVNWAIGDYYRGGHPRTYFPGPNGGNLNNGSTLTGAYQAALATSATAWLNHINALTSTNVTQVQLGTVRYQSGHNWLSPPVFKPYTSASIRPTLGIQRRRLTE